MSAHAGKKAEVSEVIITRPCRSILLAPEWPFWVCHVSHVFTHTLTHERNASVWTLNAQQTPSLTDDRTDGRDSPGFCDCAAGTGHRPAHGV